MKPLVVALACAALASCATTSGRNAAIEARGALAGKPTVEPRALEFTPLVAGEATRVAIGPGSAVIERQGRPSYAKGLRLPDGIDRVHLQVRSMGSGARRGEAIFYPDVAWLDERYDVVGRIPPERFAYRSSDVDVLTADVFVDVVSTRAKYLLVAERALAEADEAVAQTNMSGGIPVIVPVGAMLFVWMIPTGATAAPARVAASPVGTVEVLVERPVLRKLELPSAAGPEPVR